MPFIHTVARSDAQGEVQQMYEQIEQRVGFFPNWAEAFSLRPQVWQDWDRLHTSIRSNLTVREYELATLAAARALRSSYCALAHGRVLAEKVFDEQGVTAIMSNVSDSPLEPRERAMMAFVERLVLNADRMAAADVDALRAHGYTDAQIFDIAAAGAARCFFSRLLDALGLEPDARFHVVLGRTLREALTVGRPVQASA